MSITIDAHADTILKLYLSRREMDLLGLSPDLQVTGEKMRKGHLNLEVFAIFIAPYLEDRSREVALEMMDEGKEFLLDESIEFIDSRAGLTGLAETDGTGGIIALEGALPLGDRARNLKDFYEKGIRLLTLTWSRKNAFASGVTKDGDGDDGLTDEGRHLLELADQLGVVIDISHLNRKGAMQVLELSDMPVMASHSCTHAVYQNPRNLGDDEIEGISATGGVIGVNFFTRFLNGTTGATLQDVVDHIDHMVNIGGVSAVGLGSDFDGIFTTPEGLEDASQLGNLKLKLERTYSKKEIDGIMGENLRRVFDKVLK